MYVLIIKDRHTDIDIKLFNDVDKAVSVAKEIALGRDTYEDYEEYNIEGWVFHATYSGEGDSVTVREFSVEG
jgi:hypothetical protein